MKAVKRKPVSQLGWDELTPDEQGIRLKAHGVFSRMRKDKSVSLATAAKEAGISPETVQRHIAGFRKEHGQWMVLDRIFCEVPMRIISNGKPGSILVSDSRTASLIGRYESYCGTVPGNRGHILSPTVRGQEGQGIDGSYHTLETFPDVLYEIREGSEDEEFYHIYGR